MTQAKYVNRGKYTTWAKYLRISMREDHAVGPMRGKS
jgi:hypothetical protein